MHSKTFQASQTFILPFDIKALLWCFFFHSYWASIVTGKTIVLSCWHVKQSRWSVILSYGEHEFRKSFYVMLIEAACAQLQQQQKTGTALNWSYLGIFRIPLRFMLLCEQIWYFILQVSQCNNIHTHNTQYEAYEQTKKKKAKTYRNASCSMLTDHSVSRLPNE